MSFELFAAACCGSSIAFGVILLAIFWKNLLEFKLLSPKDMLMQFGFIICGFLFIIPGVLSSILAFFILIFCLVFRGKKPKPFKEEKYKNEEIIDVEIIKD